VDTSTEPKPREPLSATQCWQAYLKTPSGEHLGDLLKVVDGRAGELVELLECDFSRTSDWRTAQHLALCYAGRFQEVDGRDLVRAEYFAMRAVEISDGNVHARLALARVHWERRLPPAVHHDVDEAILSVEREGSLLSSSLRRRLLGECAMLRGLSFAYMRDVPRALAEFERAETAGALTLEGVVQILLVNEPDHLVAGDWAAARLRRVEEQLGGKAASALLRVWRRKLVTALRARSGGLVA
jgi:hypothetical protein